MADIKSQLAKAQAWVQKNPWKTAAGIAVLLAAWFMYQGVDVYLQNKTERDILKARDSAVAAIGPKSAAFSEQMMAAHKISVPTMSDEGLKLTFRNAVKDAEAVEVFSADLNVPYGDPIAFGVGQLAAQEICGEKSRLLEPFRFSRYAEGRLHPVSNSPFPWS